MQIDVRSDTPVAAARIPTDPIPFMFFVFAVVAGLGAIAVLLWRRRRPTLDHVEAALAGSDHAQAARIAATILRDHPENEDAALALAVALTRGGRPDQVVREMDERIHSRDPTDGTIHYVKGLAHLEMGDEEAGAQALAEAVRRSPSLESAVSQRLGRGTEASAYA